MNQILRKDNFSRRARGYGRSADPRTHHVWPFVAFIVLAAIALGLDRLAHPFAPAIRAAGQELSGPFVRGAHAVLRPLLVWAGRLVSLPSLTDENARLIAENQRLKSFENRTRDLERRIVSLEALSKTVADSKLPFVTARVVADGNGPFVRSVLINAGSEVGIKAGYPVLNAEGLAGRIIAVGHRVSRVLLIADFNSRVPVQMGPKLDRAVMEGDNSPLLRISYQNVTASAAPGDAVVTSGVGGVFPSGLAAGRLVDTGDSLRIEPAARLDKLDYVSVIFFDAPSAILADDKPEATAVSRSGRSGRLPPVGGSVR